MNDEGQSSIVFLGIGAILIIVCLIALGGFVTALSSGMIGILFIVGVVCIIVALAMGGTGS